MIICVCSATHAYVYSDYTWYSYNGHQYALTINYDTWVNCEGEAVAMGGHLVTINDTAEKNWLLDPSLPFGNSYAPSHLDNTAWNAIWCGLKYVSGNKALSTSWAWVSGEPITFWNPATLPNSFPYQNGIHMTFNGTYHGDAGTFNNNPAHDTDPAQYMRGVIEVVPEPATLLFLALGGLLLKRKKA
jgi:hypothetical protein